MKCPNPSNSARRAEFQGDCEIAMTTTRVVVVECAKRGEREKDRWVTF